MGCLISGRVNVNNHRLCGSLPIQDLKIGRPAPSPLLCKLLTFLGCLGNQVSLRLGDVRLPKKVWLERFKRLLCSVGSNHPFLPFFGTTSFRSYFDCILIGFLRPYLPWMYSIGDRGGSKKKFYCIFGRFTGPSKVLQTMEIFILKKSLFKRTLKKFKIQYSKFNKAIWFLSKKPKQSNYSRKLCNKHLNCSKILLNDVYFESLSSSLENNKQKSKLSTFDEFFAGTFSSCEYIQGTNTVHKNIFCKWINELFLTEHAIIFNESLNF